MLKILHITLREFGATVLTKAFLIGVLVVPVLLVAVVPLTMLLMTDRPPRVNGTVAIIDRSGLASDRITESLSEEAMTEMYRERFKATAEQVQGMIPGGIGSSALSAAGSAAAALDLPQVKAELLPTTADVEEEKKALLHDSAYDGGRLALVVVDADAVKRAEGKDAFGSFQFYVHAKLDSRVQDDIRDQARDAIIESRIVHNGKDPAELRALTSMERPRSRAVTPAGEKASGEATQFMVPLAFMMLLWVSVFTGGQFLMTSTIEEKSSRVMEVLLSAVSPMQLMTGKILGQMSAGLVILTVYSGMGTGALFYFKYQHLLSWSDLALLIVFFFIAFFTIAAMMAAVGSAVTDIHEAQTLLTPIMLIVMLPMLLMMPIIMNPNGTMATIMSFVPPIGPFVMVLRLSSSDPPPAWQTALAIVVGFGGVYAALRIAAKVFRIGVLMYGKPPNFATLLRWVRMA